MPVSTGSVSTDNDYAQDNEGNGAGGATIGLFEKISNIQFDVLDAAVIAQVGKMKKQDNSLHWDTVEVTFNPGQGGYEGEIHGLRFRSAVTDTPARVIINGYFSDDPIPFQVPFPAAPSGEGGISFDADNEGGWLDVTTNNLDGAGYGMALTDANAGGNGLLISSTSRDVSISSGKNISITAGAGAFELLAENIVFQSNLLGTQSAAIKLDPAAGNNPSLSIQDNNGNDLLFAIARNTVPRGDVILGYAGGHVGFFGAAGVAPQVSGGTLGGVIAGLVALGLFSS